MINTFSFFPIGFIAIGAILLYALILAVVFRKKLVPSLGKPTAQPLVQMSSSATGTAHSLVDQDPLPPLIDKPGDHPTAHESIFPDNDDPYYELAEEGGMTLLKAAEYVVEQIQEVVNGIASYPANPEEVFTKIRAIVSQYSIFRDTEYYDAINSFVAVTVQRDCDLSLNEEDLRALWTPDAA